MSFLIKKLKNVQNIYYICELLSYVGVAQAQYKTYGLGYTPCGFADLSAKVQKIIEF